MFGKIKYWFQNYWYYYKWPVILIAFFVGVILFCTLQSETQEETDANILFVGPHLFETGEKTTLENNLSNVLKEDYDDDGEKRVSVIEMPAFSEDEIRAAVGDSTDMNLLLKYGRLTYDEVEKNFTQQLFAGDAVICFFDPHWFDLVKENGGLMPLQEVLGYAPSDMVDEYGVKLSSLSIGAYCNLPDSTIVCFRRPSTAASLAGGKEMEKRYQNSVQVFKDLFAFE